MINDEKLGWYLKKENTKTNRSQIHKTLTPVSRRNGREFDWGSLYSGQSLSSTPVWSRLSHTRPFSGVFSCAGIKAVSEESENQGGGNFRTKGEILVTGIVYGQNYLN